MDVPVNVYGRSADATGLVYHLLATFPTATLAIEDGVSVVTAELPPGGTSVATINVATSPFEGPGGDRQREGMAAFFREQVAGPDRDRALAVIGDLSVAVAILVAEDGLADPEVEEAVLETAELVAGWVDGFVLSMAHGEVRGPDGEVWATLPHGRDEDPAPEVEPEAGPAASASGAPAIAAPPRSSAAADIPVSLIEAAAQAGDLGAGVVLVDLPDDLGTGSEGAVEPPPLSRVVARMLVLVAVSARCLTEEDGRHLEEARRGIDTWCEELGIAGEVEEHERALLAAEPGTIDRQELVNGSWGAEAAAVLAWSLQLIDLPAHDVLVAPQASYEAIGFPSSSDTIAVLGGARLRSAEELEARREQLFALHWRLRQFGLDGAPVDLAAFARTAWFGPLELPDDVLADGDLAIGGRAVADAEADLVRLATSIALERHRAIAWLVTGGRWSETDTST